jgi:transposase InsO family protein
VKAIFWKHRRRYGARRIVEELTDLGEAVSGRKVAELLKTAGLRAIQPESFKPCTTESRHRLGYKPNLLLDMQPLTAINHSTSAISRMCSCDVIAFVMPLCSWIVFSG